MDFAALMFWILATILVVAALLVVSLRNIVHSAMALFLVFAIAAGIYILLNAEFIAIVQILVYAGAVTILILFALMLTRIGRSKRTNPANRLWWVAVIISALVGGSVLYGIFNSPLAIANTGTGAGHQVTMDFNNVVAIGQLLYSPTSYSYVLPFEIASVVLLVAIVGAIIIGRED